MKQPRPGLPGTSQSSFRRPGRALDQLELDLADQERSGNLGVTRPLARHRSLRRVLAMIQYVRRFFPELDGRRLRVGLTRAASGMAVPGGDQLWVNPYRLSCHTLAHEFTHLIQSPETGIPRGEKACDVFSLARHWSINDAAPSYVRIPARLVRPDNSISALGARLLFAHASRAVENRRGGVRCCIAGFERDLARAVRAAPRSAR